MEDLAFRLEVFEACRSERACLVCRFGLSHCSSMFRSLSLLLNVLDSRCSSMLLVTTHLGSKKARPVLLATRAGLLGILSR